MAKKHLLIYGCVAGAVLMTGFGAYQFAWKDKIYAHVLVADTDLGGLTVNEASQVLQTKLNLPTVNLVWGTSTWAIPTQEFELRYDPNLSATNAYNTGRRGNSPWENLKAQIQAWNGNVTLSPSFSVNENKIVESLTPIYAQINIPVNEPEIQIKDGKIVVSAGENGQAVDERALLQLIKQSLSKADSSPINIPVKKIEPKLSESQVQTLTSQAEKLLGKKIILKFEDQTWEINETQIISWIDPSNSDTHLSWKKDQIKSWIQELAESANRSAENAHFRYLGSGKVEEFSPATDGVVVSENNLVDSLSSNLSQLVQDPGPLSLTIPVTRTSPDVTTDQVNNLGIKELVAKGESDYSGSIPNRIFNLHKAANYMNGVLIAPGEEFSFNKYVGDISAAGGYKQAYVIKQGRTVLGDGGGVCQVSSTMFRAALNAGLPITSRTAHAYRVHYYENNSQPGFDATIFTPSVDFKFKNDTPAYLLIQTVFDEAHNKLTFELYGTKDSRQVTVSKARVWGVTPPPPALYQDDPNLPNGVVQQVDFPAWGAKVAFDYKVVRDGQTLQEQTFYSNYAPWQAVYLKGTKI